VHNLGLNHKEKCTDTAQHKLTKCIQKGVVILYWIINN